MVDYFEPDKLQDTAADSLRKDLGQQAQLEGELVELRTQLEELPESIRLAREYVTANAIPSRYEDDARHIATAAGQGTMWVPVLPCSACWSRCGWVMITRLPPCSRKSTAASIFGPMLPAGKCPSAR